MEQNPPRGNGTVICKNQTTRKLTQMERLQRKKSVDSQCNRRGIHHSRINRQPRRNQQNQKRNRSHKTRQHDRQEKETTKTERTEPETDIQNQTEAIPNKTRKKDSLNKPESPPRIHHQEQIHIPDAGLSSEHMHSNNRTQITRQVQGHPNSIFMAKTTREISIYQLGVHRSFEGPNPTRTIHIRKTRPT